MKPLYTSEELTSAGSRAMLPLECAWCKQPFLRAKHHIQMALAAKNKATYDYCSQRCHNRDAVKNTCKQPVTCEQCGCATMKNASQIKRSKHHFCTQSCAGKYSSAHKTKGTRVSRLELWLQRKLQGLYPGLEFHFNRTDTVDAELDIYIPSLKLAFELNGIFHYEPVYGPEKLGRTQSNDCRKQQACNERGIALCVIDVSGQKYFKERTAAPFLEIVTDIIVRKRRESNSQGFLHSALFESAAVADLLALPKMVP